MCNLSGRFSCQKCPASSRCAVFCGADVDPQTQQAIPRLLPRSPTEVCCCGHGWISHEDRGCHDITHINYHFRKGGYMPNYCGGFYSDVTNWSYLTICVCMAGWTTHAPLQEIPDPILGNGSASAEFAPVPVPEQAPPTLPQIGGPRIPSWRGLPPVVAGNTGTRRISSAEHTLPQHSVSLTSPHRSRNNFPSSLGSASAPAASASAGVFSGLVTEPGAHEHPEFPSDHLAFRNEDALDYLTRFNTHGLLIEVNVPRQGLVRPEAFTTQLTSALLVKGLVLPPSPRVLDANQAIQLHRQPFCVLTPTRRHLVFTFTTHPGININNFGIDEFRPLNKKVRNPMPVQGTPHPLIFLCPRYGNILGAISHSDFVGQPRPSTGLTLHHPCFGVRVLHNLHYSGRRSEPEAECYLDVCPEGAIATTQPRPVTPLPTPTQSLVRPRESPASPDHRRLINSIQSPFQMGMIPSVLQFAPESPSPRASTSINTFSRTPGPSARVVSTPLAYSTFTRPAIPHQAPSVPVPEFHILKRTDISPLKPGPHLARPKHIFMWQVGLRNQLLGAVVPFVPRSDFHAISIEAAAKGIWALLLYFEQRSGPDELFPLPDGVLACTSSKTIESFFHSIRTFRIGVRQLHNGNLGNIAIGPGPERAVYRHAIATAVQNHHFWAPAASSGFFIPVFSIASVEIPERCQMFAAYGSLLALHCVILGQGPIPISIWLLLALVAGKEGMLIPPAVLLALDPEAFDALTPWLTLKRNDPMPSNLMHPTCQFLLNVMERQPWEIASNRTALFHDGCTIAFMCQVLLGGNSFWDHPEFLALKRGFNITVGETSVVTRLLKDRTAIAMLACMYDRQVRNVDDIIDRITCTTYIDSDDGTTPYFGALFRLLLIRYLAGPGHPPQACGTLVERDQWEKEEQNGVLRVGLLLEAATDTDLRPTSQSWSIKFCFSASSSGMDVDDTVNIYLTLSYHSDLKNSGDGASSPPLPYLLIRRGCEADPSNGGPPGQIMREAGR
ncbi:hypothetical protein K438DRAFT_1772222 [Mycena galopus ATCC 62051]|nr:hypothetical protein K438DRAFT_1772222 [Mycena galopus ATCC 62051]